MAEFENKIKVVIEGSTTRGEVNQEIEGVGAVVIVDTSKGLVVSLNGDWSAAKVATLIKGLEKGFGQAMFHAGLAGHLMESMIERLASKSCEENETEAAEEGEEHGEEA